MNYLYLAIGYKLWTCLGIVLFALIACALLLIRKKSKKNLFFVAILAVICLGAVLLTDFQTKESYYTPSEKKDSIGCVSLSIRCDTIVGKEESEFIPKNGIILDTTEFSIAKNDSVFDILVEATKQFKLQMENDGSITGDTGLVYVSSINNLYEFQFGELSGWVFHVNGKPISVGCAEYKLKDGDVIEWLYTCDMGDDVK